jgi:hypothetical protein
MKPDGRIGKSARDVPIESSDALSPHSVARTPRRFSGSRYCAAKALPRLGSGSPYEKANLPLSADIVPPSIKRPAFGPSHARSTTKPCRANRPFLSLVLAVGVNLLGEGRLQSSASFASKRVAHAPDPDGKNRQIEVGCSITRPCCSGR